MNIDYAGFSKKIKLIRIEKNLKQDDVAKELKISSNTYSAYENNPQLMKLSTLIALSNTFGEDLINIFLTNYATKCSK